MEKKMGDFTVNCPQCRENLMVSTDFIGQDVSCPACNFVFKVNAPGAPVPPQPQMPVPPMPPQPQMAPGAPIPPQMAPGMMPGAPIPPQTNAGTNLSKDLFSVSTFVALGALAIAVVALICNLLFSGPDTISFQDTPEDAVEEILDFRFKKNKEDKYDWRKNGSEVLDSLEIKETKINGNFAVVFYQLSRGAMTYHAAMWLKKNKDGYWVSCDASDAKREVAERWVDEMKSRVSDWGRQDSNSLDKLVE